MTAAINAIEGINVTRLERHCRRLLLAYPAGYRAARGGEIVDTVMEVNAGRKRLPIRDSGALLVGGLKVRATENRRLPMITNLRLAVLLGLILLIAPGQLHYATYQLFHPHEQYLRWPEVMACVGTLATVALAWSRRRNLMAIAAVVCVAGFVLSGVFQKPYVPSPMLDQAPWALCVASIALLARVGTRMPRAWIWLLLAFSLRAVIPYSMYSKVWLLPIIIAVTPMVAVLAWIVVDARPAIAFALFLALGIGAGELTTRLQGGSESSLPYVPLLIALAVLIPAMLRVRRQQTL